MTVYITGGAHGRSTTSSEHSVVRPAVSRICKGIDDEVATYRTRPLNHIAMPYVYLDATYIKARKNHRIVSGALVVATAITADGNREVRGADVGDEVFWTALLRTLAGPGP